jgi:hypothetical protein
MHKSKQKTLRAVAGKREEPQLQEEQLANARLACVLIVDPITQTDQLDQSAHTHAAARARRGRP